MEIDVKKVVENSDVKFGTSGARGFADDMTDFVAYAYTKGFLQYLESVNDVGNRKREIVVAGDFRPSTDRIMHAIKRAAIDSEYNPINCGKIPSPAIALYGLTQRVPSIMVTGSHIPADRNGIKFNKSTGEILKIDEQGILKQKLELNENLFSNLKWFISPDDSKWKESIDARDFYIARYTDTFPQDCLKSKKIGIYQHSAVGRDIVTEIFERLGADVVPLGRSEEFIPVDTEAIRSEDIKLASKWAREYSLDSIISTDGDSDRPLVSDERGHWIRGDITGILCGKFLKADSVSVPVSCNTAVEKVGYFKKVNRTRIGSPYVIESMIDASSKGSQVVVGYEANGGFLTNSDIFIFGKTLKALPTRDAVIVHLSLILLAAQENKSLSELVAELPRRFTASNRLQNFPQNKSQFILLHFTSGNEEEDIRRATTLFKKVSGTCSKIDRTDGIRMSFDNDEIIHLRPSGNAPEFRCYNEAASLDRVNLLNKECIKILADLKPHLGTWW